MAEDSESGGRPGNRALLSSRGACPRQSRELLKAVAARNPNVEAKASERSAPMSTFHPVPLAQGTRAQSGGQVVPPLPGIGREEVG